MEVLKKKTFAMGAVALMLILATVGSIQFTDSSEAAGSCGDSLTWSIEGNTLIIEGTGSMTSYSYISQSSSQLTTAPWKYNTEVTHVTIGEGVTSIGNYAFCGLSALKSIDMPSTLTTIGIVNAINFF